MKFSLSLWEFDVYIKLIKIYQVLAILCVFSSKTQKNNLKRQNTKLKSFSKWKYHFSFTKQFLREGHAFNNAVVVCLWNWSTSNSSAVHAVFPF